MTRVSQRLELPDGTKVIACGSAPRRRSKPEPGLELRLPLTRYQVKTVEWLLGRPYAGVFLDPGLGKTLIVLVVFYLLKRAGHLDWLLVVAPLNPCYEVWPAEVEKWGFDFKVAVLHGPHKAERLEEGADIYVINYEGLGWLRGRIGVLTARGMGWLVPDESTKVKHTSSRRHKLMKSIVPCFGRRTILTGTPSPNGYINLFGQLLVVDQGKRLGQYIGMYRNRFFVRVDVHLWVLQNKQAEKKVQDAIRDVCIYFSDRELGLKPVTLVTIPVALPPKARRIYDELERDFIAALPEGGLAVASNAGVLSQKLREVANGGLYDSDHRTHHLHDAKTEAVSDLYEELQGQSLIVGYEFDHDLERLRGAFPQAPVIRGKTTMKERGRILREFDVGEQSQPLLAQIATMALGLNLQKNCHRVCFHSLVFNAEDYIQFIKRVHRLGQAKRVIAYHVVAKDTVDDKVMMPVLRSKKRSQQALLDALRRMR